MLRAIRDELGRAGYEVKTLVAQHPSLALPIARWRGHGALLGADTDLLIEGFPRSGNSFAVAAFTMAQDRPVRVAHHVHAPAHVIAATKANVPALVVIRDPAEAIPTFFIRHPDDPELSMRQALRGYVRFYAPLIAHRERFVVGPFPDVTADFGSVIWRINRKFGTSFREFEHTEENVRACFAIIERDWERSGASGETLERIVPRPSEDRDRIKDGIRADYRAEDLADLRAKAERLYRVLRLS